MPPTPHHLIMLQRQKNHFLIRKPSHGSNMENAEKIVQQPDIGFEYELPDRNSRDGGHNCGQIKQNAVKLDARQLFVEQNRQRKTQYYCNRHIDQRKHKGNAEGFWKHGVDREYVFKIPQSCPYRRVNPVPVAKSTVKGIEDRISAQQRKSNQRGNHEQVALKSLFSPKRDMCFSDEICILSISHKFFPFHDIIFISFSRYIIYTNLCNVNIFIKNFPTL